MSLASPCFGNPHERTLCQCHSRLTTSAIFRGFIRIELVVPNLEVHNNRLTGHSVVGSYGIEVVHPEPSFEIDARRNWWGSPAGPNPPGSEGADKAVDNVTEGVNYAQPSPSP